MSAKKASKPKYSLFQNISYAIAKQWRINKATVICCLIAVVVQVGQPFIGLILPKLVIDNIEAKADVKTFLLTVGLAAILLVVISALRSYTDMIVNEAIGTFAVYDEMNSFVNKEMDMDYELLEDPEVKKVFDKASREVATNHSFPNNMLRFATNVLVNLLSLVLYGWIICTTHPLIMVLLVVCAAISWFFLSKARKYQEKHREEETEHQSKLRYMINTLLKPEGSKDIRMYGMHGWLKETTNSFMNDAFLVTRKIKWRNTYAVLIDAFLILIRDGAAYAYLIYLLLADRITLGSFVLVFAAITGLAGWISGFLVQYSDLLKSSSEMTDVRSYYTIKDRLRRDKGHPVSLDNAPRIELKDVSYTYPGAEKPTLSDINVDIAPGERIAIVGTNGAGKTTLIKMICGLYLPKTGSIAIDGTVSTEFNRDEYYTMFSVAFQDIHILAENIAMNVSQIPVEETDLKKVDECLKKAGLYEKVENLPKKEQTMMVPSINEDATTFSGGELQKLTLARAIYKDAPIIVLDEPTAALDPIAESEVYASYAALTEGKTSIYISHRLASTRFCDRILLVDNGKIAEEGSHDELMALGGLYAEMFNIQAHYYKEGNREKIL